MPPPQCRIPVALGSIIENTSVISFCGVSVCGRMWPPSAPIIENSKRALSSVRRSSRLSGLAPRDIGFFDTTL